MTLEELNNEYLRLNDATKKYAENLKNHEADLKKTEADLEIAKNNLKSATKNSDKKTYQTEVNRLVTEIADIKVQISLEKQQQQHNQESIDRLISEVKEIPGVKEQCNRAIDVKTERQIKKFEKQKKEQEEKKTSLEQLKNMIEKHPQATIIANEIENESIKISKAEGKIKDIDREIAKLDQKAPDYTMKKADLELKKIKSIATRDAAKNVRQTKRDNLKKLFNNPKYNDAIDNLTTKASLDKDINNCNRLIARSENKIHDYTYAKESLYKAGPTGPTGPTAPTGPTDPTNPTNPVPQSKWEAFKGLFSKRKPGDPGRWETIKSLFSKKAALPAPTPAPTQVKSFKDEIKIDGNIMKNEVVQKIYQDTLDKKVEDGKNER